MALYDTLSRYRNDINGQTASRLPLVAKEYTTYMVVDGDTLENLAVRHLGNARRYWEIADVNPQVKFPLDLSPGLILRMPK